MRRFTQNYMKKLLSLPPNLVECFHDVTGLSHDEFFCTNDPVGHKLGSGGGTTWLLQQAYLSEKGKVKKISMTGWLVRSVSSCMRAVRVVACRRMLPVARY